MVGRYGAGFPGCRLRHRALIHLIGASRVIGPSAVIAASPVIGPLGVIGAPRVIAVLSFHSAFRSAKTLPNLNVITPWDRPCRGSNIFGMTISTGLQPVLIWDALRAGYTGRQTLMTYNHLSNKP